MKKLVPALSGLLTVLCIAGCAAAPSAPAASAPVAAAPQAATGAVAPAAGTSAEAPIGPAVAATPDAAAIAQSAHEMGYTRKMLDGKTVYYCKTDAPVGTRLATPKCYNEDQMSAVVQREAANRQSVAEMEHKTMTQSGGT